MIIHLKPWAICYNMFNEWGFFRQAYFEDGDFVSEDDIVIAGEGNIWYIEKPFIADFINIAGDGERTPELLMFKIDLALIDNPKYVVNEPFIFPDNDL